MGAPSVDAKLSVLAELHQDLGDLPDRVVQNGRQPA
jgi:hypothetical protein